MYFIIYELSLARRKGDVWNQVVLPPLARLKLVMLHGSGTQPFFKSRATAVLKSHFILWIEFGTAVSQRLKLA